jgi:lipoyl(octanoyl) transferase
MLEPQQRPVPSRPHASARGSLAVGLRPAAGQPPAEWATAQGLVAYDAAVAVMDDRVQAIWSGRAGELVWILEHPALYTAGTSARDGQVAATDLPFVASTRGGQVTYHGPGQRIAYLMLDLKRRGPDIRRFVATLEEWLIRALARFGISGERREDRVGVWVPRPDKGPGCEDKIAAIGIRVKRWVSLHGIALNVDCDLSHFSGIVPCGVSAARYGVTSFADLGRRATMAEVDQVLRREFERLFGPTRAGGELPEVAIAAAIVGS